MDQAGTRGALTKQFSPKEQQRDTRWKLETSAGGEAGGEALRGGAEPNETQNKSQKSSTKLVRLRVLQYFRQNFLSTIFSRIEVTAVLSGRPAGV